MRKKKYIEVEPHHDEFGPPRMEPEIITAELKSKPEKKRIKGKKPVLIGLFFITIVVLASAGVYYFVWPRVEMELITAYHESTGAASSGGFINVNTQLKNVGTKTLEDVNVTIVVIETDSGEQAASATESYYNIDRGEKEEMRIEYMGDHYKAYTIELNIEFQSDGNSYTQEFIYNIEEDDAMNLYFNDNIKG
ncbi:MAG: hypothetical protein JSV49_09555 [Thermoplasmata archaeon]|nr:MAG: hypothetical protein JSV49_09555 [Thermoplasmata archaeon]